MLIEIFSHTPLWVWGLLAALLVLGLLQTRPRRVARAQLLALPVALMLLSVWSLLPTFATQPVAAGLWLLTACASAALGGRLARQTGAVWLPTERRLQLSGSWLPLALVVIIFCLRYAAGVGQALHPEWRAMPSLQWPLAALFGALSGLFLGRALGLLRLTRTPPSTIAGHAAFHRV